MIENIIEYQKKYLALLDEFKNNNNELNDYLLLIDKIDLLFKRNKKTITNFLKIHFEDYLYFGGSTYFDSNSNEINVINYSGKKLIVADPIIKLSSFLKYSDFFKFERIKEIVDAAIDNTLNLKDNMLLAQIIYINPDDYISTLKEGIYHTSRDLTIQYINDNLKTCYIDVDNFVMDNHKLSFVDLEKKFPDLNKILVTVDSTPEMSLKDKIAQGSLDCGINENKIDDLSAAEQIIFTFIGLFGQAMELKSISIILRCPLYITKPNVIFYLNCINCIDEDDKHRMLECNFLFALYKTLRGKEKVEYNPNYKKILVDIINNCSSIEEYIVELKKLLN